MSTSQSNYPGPNQFAVQPPPEHHIHRDSEPLPGVKGSSGAAPSYDASVTNDSQTWKPNGEKAFGAGSDTRAVMSGGQHNADPDSTQQREGKNAFTDDRPMNAERTNQGGVAIGGRDDLPEGHAKFTDKMVGKTQKVAGKVMGKPELHEKGELREAGGKAAVLGEAKAPHD